MSIQAVAWVLAQSGEDLPGTARLVMIALANHADHTSGHCWPSIETIAKEAGCHERTASRYISALRRNGWIDVRSTQRASGKFRSNDYWILFDHKPQRWRYYDTAAPEVDPPDDTEESVASLPHAILPDGQSETPLHEMARGPQDTGVVPHKKLEPSVIEPSARAHAEAPPLAPSGYEPTARTEQVAKLRAAEEARKPKAYPVIRGSEPWQAWVKHGHKDSLFSHVTMPDGRKDWGWYFPTLWPPRGDQTGPPRDAKKAG